MERLDVFVSIREENNNYTKNSSITNILKYAILLIGKKNTINPTNTKKEFIKDTYY